MARLRVFWLAAAALVVPAHSSANTALDSLVAAERAFSARSVESGMKTAFLEFLSEDGIVFSPGPVNAHERWRPRPESDATLIWGPSYAEVSYAGDLGLSLGPFELRPPPNADAPIVHGHFISVWGRGEGEPWRVWIDIGSVHAALGMGVDNITFDSGPEHPEPPQQGRPRFGWSAGGRVRRGGAGFGLGIGSFVAPRWDPGAMRAHAIHEMMTAERTYAFNLRNQGAARALSTVAAQDVRIFRSGGAPLVGNEAATGAAGDERKRVKWVPKGRVVSASQDLGYSYGIAIRRSRGGAKPDSSVYLHVWRNIGTDGWQLVVDVENPLARR